MTSVTVGRLTLSLIHLVERMDQKYSLWAFISHNILDWLPAAAPFSLFQQPNIINMHFWNGLFGVLALTALSQRNHTEQLWNYFGGVHVDKSKENSSSYWTTNNKQFYIHVYIWTWPFDDSSRWWYFRYFCVACLCLCDVLDFWSSRRLRFRLLLLHLFKSGFSLDCRHHGGLGRSV